MVKIKMIHISAPFSDKSKLFFFVDLLLVILLITMCRFCMEIVIKDASRSEFKVSNFGCQCYVIKLG
ncbi:hypothetical protein BD408DRAFT_408699 [Parasitella parasitica]|nr:hypothetical protein BD408DRAFT_408699 [Parasitella parasitica]